MSMNDDDDFAEFDADDPTRIGFEIWLNDPEAQKEYKRHLADSAEAERRLGRVIDRFKKLDGLPKELLWDIEIILVDYQRLQIEEKRRAIQDARRDDVADRRARVLTTAAEIESIRPGLSTRSLSELVHKRIAADKTLLPTQIPSVESVRKILADSRRSS